MSRADATITTHEDIPAFVGSDESEVFSLSFGALPYTAAHAALELVRGAYTFVALLQLYGHPYRVADAITAPVGADARLDGAQCLSVCVPALEAGINEFPPDRWQVCFLCAEEVHALRASDLGVQAI